MAPACDPEGPEREPAVFRFAVPRAPWRDAPRPARDSEEPPVRLYAWAADAVLTACCIGETLSRPLLAAVETGGTGPAGAASTRHIPLAAPPN